jgi:hypothetical protein
VEIHVTDDRLGGYFRRYQLALRMMSHGARTQTVMAYSKLTRDQLVTQRRRWGFAPEIRPKGPAPSAFHVFFRSRRHCSEAALFASLCHIGGAITASLNGVAARLVPSLELGELFCDALETFREWVPHSDLDFEHALQLATGVVRAERVTLGWCSDCQGATLFEGCRRVYAQCPHCLPPTTQSARQKGDERVVEHDEQPKPERHPDHVPEREVGTGCGNLERDRDDDPDEHETGADSLHDRGEEREDG